MAEKKVFPTQAADYDLLEEIGHGAFAVVYRAICKPFSQVVAVKCMDLDICSSNLKNVSEEVQLMSLVDHPNIIKAYCSFIVDHYLWVIMPYMDGGSCLHIMKIRYPEGVEESAIAVILKETLKGLDYLHQQQQIHRDVKAGNILIDASGTVKLGDFGTSACMFSRGDRQRTRNTITGTPCWMAPEVLEQRVGYNCSADIWSFGITALELAHGHAPFSKYPPQKVLIMTISSAPPYLAIEKDKQFSKAFKEVIKLCLNKDPSKRPSAEKLLKHPFFKHTKYNSSLVQRLLNGLGPLWEREKVLRDKDAALLALRKPAFLQEEERSRNEYKRGVSSWNFDVESLKDQAAMIHDEDEISSIGGGDAVSEAGPEKEGKGSPSGKSTRQQLTLDTNQIGRRSCEKEPKQCGRFGVFDGDMELESPGWHVVRPLTVLNEVQKLPTIVEDKGRNSLIQKGLEDFKASTNPLPMDVLPNGNSFKRNSFDDITEEAFEEILHLSTEKVDLNGVAGSSFSLEQAVSRNPEAPGCLLASIEKVGEKPNFMLRKSFSAVASSETGLIQIPSHSSLNNFDALSIPASLLGPQLKSLLMQTAKQYEVLADLLKIASPGEAVNVPLFAGHDKEFGEGESGAMDCSSNLDSHHEHQVHALQSKVASLTKELVSVKYRNMQLERQLNAIYNRQEEETIRREEAERGYS
eukprot:c25275_g1_i2 orf=493-2568(-)